MDSQFELPSDEEAGAGKARRSPSGASRSSGDPTEGVRIIGAEEAAEAMERDDVISRRAEDEPRYGDRPPPPPDGPRPTLRFPLDAGSDPTRVGRPPVQPPLDPVTGPVDLPHWTNPSTGEMPQVADDEPLVDETEQEQEAWSTFATSPPRWRDADESRSEEHEVVLDLARDERSQTEAAREQTLSGETDERLFAFREPKTDPAPEPVRRRTGSTRLARHPAAGRDAPPAPPWASVPDADDFHDATADRETSRPDPEPAPVAPAEPVGATEPVLPAADVARSAPVAATASGIYDDEDTGPINEPDGPYEKPGARAARSRRRRVAGERSTERSAGRAQTARRSADGGGGGRNLATAVVVGVLLVAVFAGLLAIGPGWAMILVTLVVFLAAGEFFDVMRRTGHGSATLFGLVACTAFPLAVYWRGLTAFPLLIVLAIGGSLAWFLAGANGPEARVIEGVGTTMLGVAWIGGMGSFAAAMLRAPDGRALLVIAALATVGYDVGGFFIGRNAGQHQLSEVSPNKTIEGLLGGMLVCVVVVIIAVGAIKLGPWDGYRPALALGLAAAVAAPLGDLCQSLIKRDLGVKDMGTILPGHGGILDRFDSLLFVLPAMYYLVALVGHRL